MPKTLTGAELQLDDGPVRDSDLFLVDGNNLAYRAFFALPEELATSEGFSTNALLGFTNMLFKLLADYRPKGVAVAWDTRPVHRTELLETYKIERKPMPDLLREAVPVLQADRRGLRLPEPRVRGLGGRRRDARSPTRPTRRGSRRPSSRPTGTPSSS
jgi:DNA polymerase-1